MGAKNLFYFFLLCVKAIPEGSVLETQPKNRIKNKGRAVMDGLRGG